VIPAAILLVMAAAGFDAAMHVPIEQALVVFVGLPLGCLWFVRTLVHIGHPTPISRPTPRTVRGQIVVTRVDEPVYRIPAMPYGDTAVRALPAARLRLLDGGRTEETA
jgi:hypothetical protein